MKHKPSTVWLTRLAATRPYQGVRTTENGLVQVSFFPGDGKDGIGIDISRRDARLLARRINQCLDETI